MSVNIDAIMDSLSQHLEMRKKNWVTTEQFKKVLRNKKLRNQLGVGVTNCPGCGKIIVSSMSLAMPQKFHRYMGNSVWAVNSGKKPVMLLCKKCHKENFEKILGHYDEKQKTHTGDHYEARTALGESILATQANGNGNG